MKIAIIGTGNLGKSIAKGLITTDAITSLYLTKRNLSELQAFEGYKNVYITSDNIEAVKQSDILIFAVQPAHFESILDTVKPYLTENHVLISTITGFAIQNIEAQVGTDHFIVRAMPNTAIAVGKSMTCFGFSLGIQIHQVKSELLEALFGFGLGARPVGGTQFIELRLRTFLPGIFGNFM